MNKVSDDSILVVLNGTDPLSALPLPVIKSYRSILAVDGALNRLLEAGIYPDAVIGDFDSVSEESVNKLRAHNGGIHKVDEQEFTDFEKALKYCNDKGYRKIDVIGYSGSRVDHQLAVWDAALRYTDRIEMRFLERETESVIISSNGSITLQSRNGCLCSVIPLLPCTGVTLEGFQWPLEDAELALGMRVSCSNRIISDNARVLLKQGAVLVSLHSSPRI